MDSRSLEIVIACNGRSLDLDMLKGRQVIAVSTAIERVRKPRWWVFSDEDWMHGPEGVNAYYDDDIECLRSPLPPPYPEESPEQEWNTSFHWALNVAEWKGATRFIFVGVDWPDRKTFALCARYLCWFIGQHPDIEYVSWSNGPLNLIRGVTPKHEALMPV